MAFGVWEAGQAHRLGGSATRQRSSILFTSPISARHRRVGKHHFEMFHNEWRVSGGLPSDAFAFLTYVLPVHSTPRLKGPVALPAPVRVFLSDLRIRNYFDAAGANDADGIMIAINHDPEITDAWKGFSVGLVGPQDRPRRSFFPFPHQFRDLGCV